jgi:hypothetical protein
MKTPKQQELPHLTQQELKLLNDLLYGGESKGIEKTTTSNSNSEEVDMKFKYEKEINRSFRKDKELLCAKTLPEIMKFIESIIKADIDMEKQKVKSMAIDRESKRREGNRFDAKKSRLKKALSEYLYFKCIAYLEKEVSKRKVKKVEEIFEEFKRQKKRSKLTG